VPSVQKISIKWRVGTALYSLFLLICPSVEKKIDGIDLRELPLSGFVAQMLEEEDNSLIIKGPGS